MIAKTVAFLKDVRSELAQVSWPSPRELIGSARVVLVSAAMLAFVIAVFDLIFARLISLVLR